jgi:hypothetical protein
VRLYGKRDIISTIGTVAKDSGLSSTDFCAVHYCTRCSWWTLDDPADWCTNIVPDPGFENILGERKDDIEIEYEYCQFAYPFEDGKHPWWPNKKQSEQLIKGNKLFVAGCWIVDCGHDDPYKTEIHPPAIMINMYTADMNTQPATIGEVCSWQWWYPGSSVEVDIYPPPRPAADAMLTVSMPKSTACDGYEFSFLPKGFYNHVHLRITGRCDSLFGPPQEYGMEEYYKKAVNKVGLIVLRWQ